MQPKEATAAAPAQEEVKAALPEDVVVTLEHPSFGSYTFREQEGKLSSAISSAISRARKEHGVRVQVAELDDAQHALGSDMARARARVTAAETLGDTAAKQREEAALEKLEGQVQGFAEQRQKVLATLKQ